MFKNIACRLLHWTVNCYGLLHWTYAGFHVSLTNGVVSPLAIVQLQPCRCMPCSSHVCSRWSAEQGLLDQGDHMNSSCDGVVKGLCAVTDSGGHKDLELYIEFQMEFTYVVKTW